MVPSLVPEATWLGKAAALSAQFADAYGEVADPVPEFTIRCSPNCLVPGDEAVAVPPIAVIIKAPLVRVAPLTVMV